MGSRRVVGLHVGGVSGLRCRANCANCAKTLVAYELSHGSNGLTDTILAQPFVPKPRGLVPKLPLPLSSPLIPLHRAPSLGRR